MGRWLAVASTLTATWAAAGKDRQAVSSARERVARTKCFRTDGRMRDCQRPGRHRLDDANLRATRYERDMARIRRGVAGSTVPAFIAVNLAGRKLDRKVTEAAPLLG